MNMFEEPAAKQIRARQAKQIVTGGTDEFGCSIGGMIKTRLEREAIPADVAFYYLDLIRYRNVSNRIATDYRVKHESPQMLLIRDGKCIYHESHTGISMAEVAAKAVV